MFMYNADAVHIDRTHISGVMIIQNTEFSIELQCEAKRM